MCPASATARQTQVRWVRVRAGVLEKRSWDMRERALERRVQLAAATRQVVLEPLGVEAQHRRQPPDGHLLDRPLPRLAPAEWRILCNRAHPFHEQPMLKRQPAC